MKALLCKMGYKEPGGKPNYPVAIELFEDAIKLNNPAAMGQRAFMYKLGEGEPDGKPNPGLAAKLYRRAALRTKTANDEELTKQAKLQLLSRAMQFPIDESHLKWTEQSLLDLAKQYPNDRAVQFHAVVYLHPELYFCPKNFFAPNICHLELLVQDDLLTTQEKYNLLNKHIESPIEFFKMIKGNQQALLFYGEHHIQNAKTLRLQVVTGDQTPETVKLLNNKSTKAFELANLALTKLQSLESNLAKTLHDCLQFALVETDVRFAHTTASSFVYAVQCLRQMTDDPAVLRKLFDVLMLTNITPFFTEKEKFRLLLALASQIDPQGIQSDLQLFVENIITTMKLGKQMFMNRSMSSHTHTICFDYLVTLANGISQKDITKENAESRATLKVILSKSTDYHPDLEKALLENEQIDDALKNRFGDVILKTYQEAIYGSFPEDAKPKHLKQHLVTLFSRLDELVGYFEVYPEMFNTGTNCPDQHDGEQNNNNASFTPDRDGCPAFEKYLKKQPLVRAIIDATQAHQKSITTGYTYAFFNNPVSKWLFSSKEENNNNDDHKKQSQILLASCKDPSANVITCVNKIHAFLQNEVDLGLKTFAYFLLRELATQLNFTPISARDSLSDYRNSLCDALQEKFDIITSLFESKFYN